MDECKPLPPLVLGAGNALGAGIANFLAPPPLAVGPSPRFSLDTSRGATASRVHHLRKTSISSGRVGLTLQSDLAQAWQWIGDECKGILTINGTVGERWHINAKALATEG